ncbi:MAG: hypothetical protein Q8O55_08890 [Dehalococcoidales bacterium]|nr:hypothetical protein [Dehalococcoidales bacterium]
MQKCDPKKIDQVLEELKAFQAEVSSAAEERQKRMDTLAKELNGQIMAEQMKLATFVAKYQKVTGDVDGAIKHCIGILDEVLHNPALGNGAKFQVDTCTDIHDASCPPELPAKKRK